MYSEKTNVKDSIMSNEPVFEWFIDQKNQKLNMQTRFLDEILANMSQIKWRAGPKENYESIKTNNLFLFILFMSNKVIARKQILKSFIKFDKNISQNFKLIFLYIDLDNYECKELHCTNWYTIRKTYFKCKIMRHYCVEFVPRLLVIDLKTGDLLNGKIMCRMTEQYYEIMHKSVLYECVSSRRYLCPEILSKLKENLTDVCVDAKKDPETRELFLLYFCSYHTAIRTMEKFIQITNFLSQMPQLIKYLINVVLISSDPSKESYLKLIEEIKSKINMTLKLSALNFESNDTKENLFRDLQIISIPWFLMIDSKKGLILCDDLNFFIKNNSNNISTLNSDLVE